MFDGYLIFVCAFLIGTLFGFIVMSNASEKVIIGRIKAGYFDHEGKAYRVEEVKK